MILCLKQELKASRSVAASRGPICTMKSPHRLDLGGQILASTCFLPPVVQRTALYGLPGTRTASLVLQTPHAAMQQVGAGATCPDERAA